MGQGGQCTYIRDTGNHHSCCDPFGQCQKKKKEWVGQWEKTICLLLNLNRSCLSEQLCQCKTIAFLSFLVLPVPPQGHRVDGSAEHSHALCETSWLWQRLRLCLKLLKEATGPHQQLEGWGGEFQVAGDGTRGITARPRKYLSANPWGLEGMYLPGVDWQVGRRFLLFR